jgi:hypothetical protein
MYVAFPKSRKAHRFKGTIYSLNPSGKSSMKRFLQIFAIVTLAVATLMITVHVGKAELLDGQRVRVVPTLPNLNLPVQALPKRDPNDLLSDACAVKPVIRSSKLRRLPAIRGNVPLSRFRRESGPTDLTKQTSTKTFKPREEVALAHPTNFGRRFTKDLNGNPASNDAIVVLHETVGSGRSAINYFQTPHPRDDDQVSYHSLIQEDGTVVYLVPPDRRAFGAGNSIFNGPKGNEAVKTNPVLPASVNNFAYHISLVTPPDGRGNGSRHSGYTRAQYESLAWLIAKTGVDNDRITTHQLVDRSRQRRDPRSFNAKYFAEVLDRYPKANDISMQCTLPAIPQEE